MAKTDTFQCSVITPERVVIDTPATFVAFPAHDGEVGILSHRAPLVYKLGVGELRIKTPSETQHYFIDGGFAQMVDNKLAILTEQAKKNTDIQASAAEKELAEARSLPGAAAQAKKDQAIFRAKTKLRIARKSG